MENADKTTFSLDDEEIIEEEVIDRDEEYDDDSDEEYDDYGDEEYDEDYEDDYGDEEYDDEYDDGYNDDYYDERFNKVLDEIADIKRNMANPPAPVVQQPPIMPPPQYVYQPSAPPAGSEIVMYNEISRLRDELAKNQNSLEMQRELQRIKDDMARDQKFAESQYNAEIKRLQDKIEELLKNADGPQSDDAEVGGRFGGDHSALDLDKLLSINEAVLRTMHESDSRIHSEIAALRKRVDEFPSSDELSRLISAVKKAASSSEGLNNETLAKLESELHSLRAVLGEKAVAAPVAVPVASNGTPDPVAASELLRQLYDIKNVLGSSSAAAVERARLVLDLLSELKKVSFDIHSETVAFKDKLNAVHAFSKKLAECGEQDVAELIGLTNALITELASTPLSRSVFADVCSYCSDNGVGSITTAVRDGAERFFNISDRLATATLDELLGYLPDLVAEKNKLQNKAHEADNTALFNEITEAMAQEKRDEKAIRETVAKLALVTVSDIVALPFVDAPKTYNATRTVDDDSVFTKLADLKAAIEESRAATKTAIEETLAAAQSAAPDTAEQAHAEPEQAQTELSEAEELRDEAIDAMLDAIADLKATVLASSAAQGESNNMSANTEVRTVDSNGDVAAALERIRADYLDVSQKLVEISEAIAENGKTETVTTVEHEPQQPALTDDEKAALIGDLQYIRTKLDEQDAFISQIGDMRSDILGISSSVDFTEQFTAQLNEITAQFDKLYEDISNILIESEANIINHITDRTAVTDAIAQARDEIIVETQALRDAMNVAPLADSLEILKADTQDIKDSLILVNDAVINTPLADAIEQLRSDLSAFADLTAANVDSSAADRQKLLDDVAYLREQYELILADREQARDIINTAATNDDDKMSAYLDEIAARVGALATVPEDAAATRETVSAVADNVAAALEILSTLGNADDIIAIKDNVAAVLETVAPINENIAAVLETVAPLNENVAAVLETVAPINENVGAILDTVTPFADELLATRDAANAALDALTPITEQLNSILDRLDAEEVGGEVIADENTEVYDDGMEQIRDDLNTILDTLPLMPQSDDLIAARDNTYSILDALGAMPQSDDVVTTRDNVAAILDAVAALSDSVRALAENGNNGTMADDIAAIRTDTDALFAALPNGFADEWNALREDRDKLVEGLDDVKYIRQKFDETNANEEVGDSLANVLQDIGLVLDKLEVFGQALATNKQEIVDAVNDIREEVHITELHDSVTATGIDDQTRDLLVSEIAEIRERLANIENTTQAVTDANTLALENINNGLAELQSSLGENVGGADNAEFNAALSESIEQIKEMLQYQGSLDAVAEDIAEIKARLENGVSVSGDGLSNDNVQAIIDELSAIKEKIDAESEYDTVAEILSLREDVKAVRIVDQDEITGELESIKNELAALASESILDEIRALRDDVANVAAASGESVAAPSADELNLVLNEIVSLRDEVFALKDEVLAATSETAQPETDEVVGDTVSSASDENIGIILDEITALRADQGTITDNIDELKDMISRRTTLAADAETDSDAITAASNELNVVLDEIINLKNDIASIDERPNERIDALTEQVGELRAMLEDMSAAIASPATETVDTDESVEPEHSAIDAAIAEINDKIFDISTAVENIDLNAATQSDTDIILDRIAELAAAVSDLGVNSADAVTTDESGEPVVSVALSDRFDALHAEMDEIRAAIGELAPATADVSGEVAELRAEVEALRAENERLRSESESTVAGELAELKDAIRDMMLASAPVASADGDTSYGALIDEIRSLKAEVAAVRTAPAAATLDGDALRSIRDSLAEQSGADVSLTEELGEIRDEIAQLRSLTTVAAESSGSAEMAAIRADIADLRRALGEGDSMYGLAEDVTTIRADVRTLKDEPDLGVMSEILALREEFQTLREEIEDVKRIAGETDSKSDEAILTEVQSLRDQLFAISMANVNDSRSGETNYESYNNLILDELASLREQVESAGSSEELRAVYDEISQIKAALDERDDALSDLARRVATLATDATNARILEELDSLRSELANQRDADLTTLNFMSEMAHLLERQNSYIAQNTGTKITDEIESLKAELASTDAVAEEVAKLRAAMAHGTGATFDNDAILAALAELREELGKDEKPSRENELILQEIARLRDEVTAIAERGGSSDAAVGDEELSESLSELKNQLNEIAGIVEPEKKPAAKRSTSTAKKKSSGSSTGAKRGRKPGSKNKPKTPAAPKSAKVDRAPTATEPQNTEPDLDSVIDEQAAALVGGDDSSLSMPKTQEVADQLDKLAQKVANKLVIEQLVEQLGTDGVSDERVEEVLSELPVELTTVALDEQSEQVRRLANQLVIKKLRERLNGKKSDDNE